MLDRVTIERMRAIAGGGPIALALSGGGDSVALAHLLVESLGPRNLRAFIVDHALRQGSANDAVATRRLAEALGFETEVLTLNWAGAPARSQQAARTARHRALCDAARDAGARVIALAHTADDQAETVFMRAAAGSGWRGLAGMAAIAPSPVWPEGRGLAIARPLLHVRRAALRAYLEDRSASWIEDPANANPAFERVRVRARLAALEAAGLSPLRFAGLADRLRPHVEAEDAAAAALIARAARFEGPRVIVRRDAWIGDPQVRLRALGVLLAAASGAARAPDAAALARLENRIAKEEFRGASLGGARLSPRGADIAVDRDAGALLGRAGGPARMSPVVLEPGKTVVWDGRVALQAHEPGWIVEPSESGEPVLRRDEPARPRDSVSLEWLIEAHVQRLLAFR